MLESQSDLCAILREGLCDELGHVVGRREMAGCHHLNAKALAAFRVGLHTVGPNVGPLRYVLSPPTGKVRGSIAGCVRQTCG